MHSFHLAKENLSLAGLILAFLKNLATPCPILSIIFKTNQIRLILANEMGATKCILFNWPKKLFPDLG